MKDVWIMVAYPKYVSYTTKYTIWKGFVVKYVWKTFFTVSIS